MSESVLDNPIESTGDEPRPGRLRSALRVAEVRLRIPAILLIAAIVVGRWDWIRNHWDKLTRSSSVGDAATGPVSNDTEYFCPMDPGVIADWPGRCGVCNMALVRRKRGEAVALPDGVVARMQLSPYRVQLAGIRTAPLGYLPLNRTYHSAGIVRRVGSSLLVPVDLPASVAGNLDDGGSVSIRSPELPGGDSLRGRFKKDAVPGRSEAVLPRGAIVLDPDAADVDPGMLVEMTCATPVCRLEPFRSMPTDPPALKPGEPRALYSCPIHPEITSTVPGRCSLDRNQLVPRSLSLLQRLRWWCPMHPEVQADRSGETCKGCGGMVLKPRIVSFAPAGHVLAVPEPAVVDSGLRTVVFVELMPGTFEGVEVELGPRCGDYYPVVKGLEPGQRVAISGAFLLDAETRLNPSLASAYFGASGKRAGDAPNSISAPGTSREASALANLSDEDRRLAERQGTCPVTGKPLGSMGKPPRIEVAGRIVFLCCSGCEDAVRSNPAKYLAKLPVEPRP